MQPHTGRRATARGLALGLVLVTTLLGWTTPAAAFGSGGVVTLHTADRVNRGFRLAMLPDGGVVVAGTSEDAATGEQALILVSYDKDGALRAAFGADGVAAYSFPQGDITGVAGLVRMSDGRLVVAGTVDSGGQTAFLTARFLEDGSPDTSFMGAGWRTDRVDGVTHINTAHALAVQPDGRILVGGTAGNVEVGGDQLWVLIRMTPDGLLDGSFGTGGAVTDDFSPINHESVNAILVQADGRVIAAGGAGLDRLHLARYMPNGARDASFGAGGVVTNHDLGPATAIVPVPGGFLVAGNDFEVSRSASGLPPVQLGWLQRFGPDGSLDLGLRVENTLTRLADGSIGPSRRTLHEINDIAVYPNGKIAVVGLMDGRFAFGVHNPDGSWDAAFGDAGIARVDALGATSQATAFVRDGYARLVAAGWAGDDLAVVEHAGAREQFAVSFSSPVFEGAEGAPASIEVRLGAAQASAVSVDYATADGTAAAGADYVPASGTIVFAPGETRKTFSVEVVADGVAEADESVSLRLANASGALLGGPNPATLTVSDGPRVGFASASSAAAEASGAAKAQVTLNAPAPSTVEVAFSVTGGSATFGADFTGVSGILAFAPGQTVAFVEVPLVRDEVSEGEETVVLTLDSPVGASLLAGRETTTLSILDDPSSCAVCRSVDVAERAGWLVLPVQLPFVPPDPVVVTYATSDGTALAGVDYAASQGTLTFGRSVEQATIRIPILADQVYDPDETFVITFSGDAIPTLGPMAIVRILDATIVVGTTAQDGPSCSLTSAIRSANEDQAIGGCQAGRGDDVIYVPAGRYVMTQIGYEGERNYCCGGAGPMGNGPSALPPIDSRIRIIGAGIDETVLERAASAPQMRLFNNHQELWLDRLTIRGGRPALSVSGFTAINGNGGAVIGGTLHTNEVLFEQNWAPNGGAFAHGTLDATGSRFENNRSDNYGGALFGVSLTATDSVFSGNQTGYMGGVLAAECGSVNVTRSVFSGNTAGGPGGAIWGGCYWSYASITVTDSRFDTNIATEGGAIQADGYFSITRTRFLNNTVSGGGGAISGALRWGSISDSTFTDNVAAGNSGGGAIRATATGCCEPGAFSVIGSTFARNSAGRGGAIELVAPTLTLSNSTFSGNSAGTGSAIYAAGAGPHAFNNVTITNQTGGAALYTDASARIANSLIAGNGTDVVRGGGAITSMGHNLIGNGDASGVAWDATDRVGTAALPIDPRLGSLASNGGPTETQMPLAGSPAIDAGDPSAPGSGGSGCEAKDQLGRNRPGEGTAACDIGAVERQVTGDADLSVSKTATSLFAYVGQPVTYRVTIVNNGTAPAADVALSDPLPAQMSAVGASASQGACAVTGNVVDCALGDLGPGAAATADIVVIPLAAGPTWNGATITAAGVGVPAGGIAAAGDIVAREPIRVTTTLQAGGAEDCTLSDAIRAANTDQPVNGCRAGNGRDLILLPAGTYLMTEVGYQDTWYCCGGAGPFGNGPTALPAASGRLGIHGEGAGLTFIERDSLAPEMRLFVNNGELTLDGLTIRGGSPATWAAGWKSVNASGGAIVGGTVIARNVVFENNTTKGEGGAFSGGFLKAIRSTFRNNSADGRGGAVSGSLEAESSLFTANTAAAGGAFNGGCNGSLRATATTFSGNRATNGSGGAAVIDACYLSQGTVVLADSVFSDNSASSAHGSGGALKTDAWHTITRTRFTGNVAADAGGAIAGLVWGTITDSTFADNRVWFDGGAIDTSNAYWAGGWLTISGSTFARNSSLRRGALSLRGPTLTVLNSTFSGNSTQESWQGASAITVQGNATFNNLTLTGNAGSGAIIVWSGSLRIANSLVAGNPGGDMGLWGGSITSLGHNLIGNGQGSGVTWGETDLVGTAAQPIDPLLAPLADNGGFTQTAALLAGSPALDAGSPALPGSGGGACEATDQRGVARPGENTPACDIGAFEAFLAVQGADLALAASTSPQPPVTGEPLSYTLEVRNLGPANASGVNVTVTLPAGARVVSVAGTQGTHMQPDGQVIFNVGTLNAGAVATLSVVVVPTMVGEITFAAYATAVQSDPNPANGSLATAMSSVPSSDVSLVHVSPGRVGSSGAALLTLEGVGFTDGATVEVLDQTGIPQRSGIDVLVDPQGLKAYAYFDLRGLALGRFDLRLTNPDGRAATLPAGLTVEPPKSPELYAEVLGPDSVRGGQTVVYQLVIGNRGNADAFGVPMFLQLPGFASATMRFPTLPVQPPPDLPPAMEFDPAWVPTVLTGSGDGTSVVHPFYIPVLRAGGRYTVSFSLGIPVRPPAGSFNIRVYSHSAVAQLADLSAGAATTLELPGAGRGPALLDAPGGQAGGTDGCGFGLGLSPEGNACMTAIFNEMINLVGTLPMPQPVLACVAAGAGASVNSISGMFCTPPSDGFGAFNLAQSVYANFVGAAGSCVENLMGEEALAQLGRALGKLNPVLNWLQVGTGLWDVIDKCGWPYSIDTSRGISIVVSADPNAKIGPAGVEVSRYVTGDGGFAYSILFENKPEATAPAQTVEITDQLDTANLDLSTFSFGPVRFGDTEVTLPDDQIDVTRDVDLRPANNLIVRIHAGLNPATGLVRWEFTSLDPATGEPTTDALAGFLPPNVTSPEGDGSVTFFVQPKQGLPTGTEVRNQARIIFDLNDPIDTNVWTNTIDNTAPASQMAPLAAVQTGSRFAVSWSGSDAGSGVRDYTIHVSRDGGAFSEWLSGTPETSAIFAGDPGHSYTFSVAARDQAYNRESKSIGAEATTTVLPIWLGLDSAGYVVSEGEGSAQITVVRSGNTGDEVSVHYDTADVSATAGQDYSPVSGTLTFASGETAKTFSIPVLSDDVPEPDEQVWIKLSQATGGATIFGAQATLTIRDDEPPILSTPGDLVVEATGPTGSVVTYVVQATSHIDGDLAAACAPGSGEVFPLGVTTVTCTATDSRGAAASTSFSVTVRDTTPPVVTVPASMTVEADGPAGAVVSFTASAADLVGGDVPVTCAPASGGTFALGTSAVTCTAADGTGNVGSARFQVTVADTTAPVVSVPGPMVVEATGAEGALVSYTASASDRVSGPLAVTCEPPSSAAFPLGSTTATCSATDSSGNTGSASFVVTVRDSTPPWVACGLADGAWHPDNILVACTASDVVGLANAADASFALVTTVPEGTETANAETSSRTVCDAAGNCVTAGPVSGNRVDRKAPAIRIAAPLATTYLLGATVVADYTCADGGAGVATCAGPVVVGGPVETSIEGTHTFTVTATDAVGNAGSASVTYAVAAPPPTGLPGRMHGEGHVELEGLKHHFSFRVSERSEGGERGELRYWFEQKPPRGQRDRRVHRFESRGVTSVLFSDAPALQPGSRVAADTVLFSGSGRWDGAEGYSFEARALDAGEPGRGRDQMAVTVLDRSGTVVASFSGALGGGNIQSLRPRPRLAHEKREHQQGEDGRR